MGEILCRKCRGKLEKTAKGYMCIDCGSYAEWLTEEDMLGVETKESRPDNKAGGNRFTKKIMAVCGLVVLLIMVIAVSNFIGNGSGFSNRAIIKIIEKNGFENSIDTETVKEISKIDLKTNVPGLPSGYSLLLLNSNDSGQYTVVLVNYSSEHMQLFDYGGYFPLKVIVDDYVSCLSEQEQVEHLGYLAKYINEYGVNCFESRDVAEAYIKEMEKFYDVGDARSSIEISAMFKLPNSQDISDFKVIFQGKTAVPLYYAFMTKSVERNPNWGYIDVNSLNGIQIDFFTQRFGPLYIEKEIWHAYSRDFNLMDSSFKSSTYKKLEEELLRTHQIVYGNIEETSPKTNE